MTERIQQCVDTSLFGQVCDYCDGGAIWKIISECLTIITVLVGVFAVIGIIIAGIQYMTSAGDVALQTKARRRLTEILIGIGCYGLLFTFAEFLIPGGVLRSTLDETTSSCPEPPPEPTTQDPTSQDPTSQDPQGGDEQQQDQGISCSANPNTVESGGYCYAKTQILATDYVRNACSRYHSCQSYKSDAWGSKCAQFATINANEMMHGFPSSPHETVSGGARVSSVTINLPDNSPVMCNGSVRTTSSSGSVSRTSMKQVVKTLVEQIMAGKPVSIAMATKRLGVSSSSRVRHFVTMVGVSSFVNATNVNNIEVVFEDGHCLGGATEPYDQPKITLNGREVKFRYVDPWGATMGTTNERSSRLWRFDYNVQAWHIYTY